MPRQRSTPHTFEQRLDEAKARIRDRISQLPPGKERDELEQKIGQLETAASWNQALLPSSIQSK
ncbi:hypothetical protein NLM31_38030 [Bradyrhizobium sp. CCGUVB4N]|uniref:hypothetical protein n=1 Tax=Bradyrhizobium sp. CCGUVB4N TaxID=2949631 RepID=UPI0020B383A5|nr:hypothetical protein [Bradyrhizobium sp. CCGUVB4N]MCP3386196.1 hypothetical protein [Bradyrhizobium sp. CCGUVB4N]